MESRHELVDSIYAHIMNEDNMMKMVLHNSVTTCMNLDVANDVLKTNFHHLAELMVCNNLALLGVKPFREGGTVIFSFKSHSF